MRDSALATIVDLGALAVACMLTLRLLRRLDTGSGGPVALKNHSEKAKTLKARVRNFFIG